MDTFCYTEVNFLEENQLEAVCGVHTVAYNQPPLLYSSHIPSQQDNPKALTRILCFFVHLKEIKRKLATDFQCPTDFLTIWHLLSKD